VWHGNCSLPAAGAGAEVTGIDIAPNLLEQARKRAQDEKLQIRFEEGDAEDLPVGDGQFDFVLSMFGAMFAPRPERVAAELLRVCKPGGTIAMANWVPDGFVAESFRITSEIAPPPPGMAIPVLWGDEKVVRQRFAAASKVTTDRIPFQMNFPFPPRQVVEFFRQYFGPIQMTFARLDSASQSVWRRDWRRCGRNTTRLKTGLPAWTMRTWTCA
jgi:SAM-dependent methyltransferase